MDGKVDSGLLITRRSFCEALVSGFAGAWLPALSAAAAQNQKVSNILINGDFEQDLTVGWSLNTATSGKGLAYRSQVLVHSGKFSLRLFPNRNNVVSPG